MNTHKNLNANDKVTFVDYGSNFYGHTGVIVCESHQNAENVRFFKVSIPAMRNVVLTVPEHCIVRS